MGSVLAETGAGGAEAVGAAVVSAAGGGLASTGGGAGAVSAGSISGVASPGLPGLTATASSAAFAALADFTSRGGPSFGTAGAAASGAAPPRPPRFAVARCEKSDPAGRVTFRLRARRSANCRATISSTVLDTLLASIPCCVRSNCTTSWLGMPRTSAIL